jgi:agmatinase
MSSSDLLWACRAIGMGIRVIGAEIVEVNPTAIGSSDITALVAARVVNELLTGVAAARRSRPQRPSGVAAGRPA